MKRKEKERKGKGENGKKKKRRRRKRSGGRGCIYSNDVKNGAPKHGRMASGGHGLFKVLPGPAMPYPSTPCGRATPEMALRPFHGWPTHRAGQVACGRLPPIWRRHAIRLWKVQLEEKPFGINLGQAETRKSVWMNPKR
jgi:hypothetical protein